MSPPRSRSYFRLRPGLLVSLALLVLIAVLVKRDTAYDSYAEVDSRRYHDVINASQVKIAVFFADGEKELYYGMLLAFADPNVHIKSANKNVRVEITPISTGNGVTAIGEQIALARNISRDPTYIAAVGHSTSAIASAASVSYEENNLIYIATTATDPSITRHDFGYVFRTIPTDEELSNAAASLCRWLRVKPTNSADAPSLSVSRIGIFYEQIRHSDEVLKDLEHALTRNGISIAFEKPYDPRLLPERNRATLAQHQGAAQLQDEIDSVSESPPEMIAVIGDNAPPATALWEGLSRSHLRDVPLVMMTGPLDSNEFIDHTQRQMVHDTSYPTILSFDDMPAPSQSSSDQDLQPGALYVATDFTTAESRLSDDFLKTYPAMSGIREAAQDFATLYEQKFGGNDIQAPYRLPEALAMRGYVAGKILRQAIENSDSVAPIDLQQTIRIGTFKALGRTYHFTLSGDEKDFGTEKVPVMFKRFSRRSQP